MHVLHVDENHPLLLDNLAQAGFKIIIFTINKLYLKINY